ncbi:hypothetical protein [Paraburkholderia aromaticivorans]|uniref:hypothetical protein n=1 Tax=Paraburkholderia aromaticivorans TaxID=2026199 RepID=UPI001FCA37DE|nr:hypothetical protein [Paraburkholderia aromaticivorans]
MHVPAVATHSQPAIATARFASAVHSLSCAIAGFALLAGARAFMFIALLGWREPVLAGAGLVLLALVGWLRWHCGGGAALPAARADRADRAVTRPPTRRAAAARYPPGMCATLLATIVRWKAIRSAGPSSSSRACRLGSTRTRA